MNSVRTNGWITAAAVAGLVLWTAHAWAVKPAVWNHTTEADFTQGKSESVVVTSQGELTLGRAVKVLVGAEAAPVTLTALAVADDLVYAAAGDKNIVYRLERDKLVEFAKPEGTIITCLVWTGKDLLVGTGGPGAGIYRIDPKGQVAKVWSDPQVQYVWAIAPGAGGQIYAGTGSEGKVFAIAAGKAEILWQAGELAKNVLCLALGEPGILYAGTDSDGLVIEIDLGRKAGRVILDAAEKEISALACPAGGGVYVATADLARVAPDGNVPPSGERAGRPASSPATPAGPAPAPQPQTAPAPEKSEPKKPGAKEEPKKPADAPKPDAPAAKAAPAPATQPAAAAKAAGAEAPAGPPARPAAPVMIVRQGPPPGGPGPAPGGAPGPEQPQGGNAVYFIAKDGLVKTVFRRPVAILSMLCVNDQILVGTGNAGVVYSIRPGHDEIIQLADTEAKAVTALAVGADKTLLLGTSNRGSLAQLSTAPAERGTYTSPALDAGQISQWGTVQVAARQDGGGKLTFATRSGNLAKPDDKTWSAWSNEQPVNGDFLSIASPAGRFLQYRLTFAGANGQGPVVRQVQVIYQTPNLPPEVAGVMVMASARGMDASVKEIGPKVYRHIMIRAGDANQDGLSFDIECRRLDQHVWVKIAKELAEPRYIWDTRTLGDGLYELRVTASDSPNNAAAQALAAARISEPVIVDNAAPTVRDLALKVEGAKAAVRGQAVEAVSRIVAIHYSLDGQETWQAVLPSDGICDSQKESFSFQTANLEPGTHLVTVRVTDLFENTGYATVSVTVAK